MISIYKLYSKACVSKEDYDRFKLIYIRIHRKVINLIIVISFLLISVVIIKKFNKKKNEIYLPYMQNIVDDINKEMDKILLLETREKQNESFRRLKLKYPLEPIRMTLTTAVFKCTKTNPTLVLKRVIKNPESNLNEDEMSMSLRGENLVKTLKSFRTSRIKENGQKEVYIWLLFEYLDVKLSQKAIRGNERIIRDIMRDALKGLVQLHSMSIAHLDLKIGNIMGKTTPNGIVYKLIDFGYTQKVNSNGYKVIPGKNYGTYPYKPPEIVFHHKHTLKSDIWSLGAIAWFLSLQYTPFYLENQTKNMQAYKEFLTEKKNDKEKKYHRFIFAENTSRNLKDFIKTCMAVNFEERPSAYKLLNYHPFIIDEPLIFEDTSSIE